MSKIKADQIQDDLINRLNNENKFIIVGKTTDETLTTEAIEISSGTDIGKKPFIQPASTGTTRIMTLGNIGVNGEDSINFRGDITDDTAILDVVPDSGISFLNLPSGDAFRVSGGELAVATKISNTEWRLDGSFTTFSQVVDPTNNANYIGRFDPTSIGTGSEVEDDAITVWNNLNGSGVGNMTLNNCILHIEGGQRQVDLSGASGSFGSIPDAQFNPTPQTDEFTIAVRVGYDSTIDDVLFGKVQLNYNTSGQIVVHQSSGSYRSRVGGTESNAGTFNLAAGDVVILTVRTTGMDLYVNGTLEVDNGAIGTVTTTNDLIFGSRFDGTSLNWGGSFSHAYIKDQAIDSTEEATLRNWMNS